MYGNESALPSGRPSQGQLLIKRVPFDDEEAKQAYTLCNQVVKSTKSQELERKLTQGPMNARPAATGASPPQAVASQEGLRATKGSLGHTTEGGGSDHTPLPEEGSAELREQSKP